MTITAAEIRTMLTNMGMPPHLTGFYMCAEAIELVAKEPKLARGNITKKIYPTVAQLFETTPKNTERCIRSAIERMYDSSPYRDIERYTVIPCSPDTGKPSNSELIWALARYIWDNKKSPPDETTIQRGQQP